jgi:hypothetical protein
MKDKDIKLNANGIAAQFKSIFSKLNAYRVFIFFLLAASVYGYILWRINVLSNAPPGASQATITKSAPHIDQDTLDKIQSLQDNSVSVQTIFQEARENPFNE